MSNLNKRNPLSKAVRNALFAGAALAVAMPSVVFAEDAAEDAEEHRVTITGSRIKQTDLEGPTPVTVITREQIDLSGHQTVADLIRTLIDLPKTMRVICRLEFILRIKECLPQVMRRILQQWQHSTSTFLRC